ncbi:MAG: TlpA family protein disulfide reductase [Candidatus Sabulitectum sp.]|nr:TlpA family protein disulfide reductase [Candidatus Sabulitectum sp.]
MRKLIISGFLFLFFACGEPAEVVTDTAGSLVSADIATDPVALLTAVTDAVFAVEAVSYSIALDGFFVDGDTTDISVAGEVVLQKGATTDEALVFADYTLTIGDEVVPGTVASDGVTAYFIDPVSEGFYFGAIAEGASRLVQNAPQGIIMVEYLITTEPYGAELNAAGYEMLEQETIEGSLCFVVAVQMPPYTSTWWIDAETHLPRANKISVWGPDGLGMEYTVTLIDLDVEAQPDPSIFQLQPPEGYTTEEYTGAVSVGSAAPLWTLDTPDGGSISLEDFRGQVVIMDFWATWCGPCRQVMPALQEIHETYGEELTVIGVNTWEREDPAAFMTDNGYTYPIVINGDAVAQEYFVEGIPTFYVIAQDGTVAFHAVGADPANEEALAEVLGTLLAE